MITSLDISNFLQEAEEEFPVDSWIYKDFHLWPLIRILIFSILKGEESVKTTGKRSNVLTKIINRVITYYNYLFFAYLKRSKYILFVSFEKHLFNYRKKSYNKFFEFIANSLLPHGEQVFIAEVRDSGELPIRGPYLSRKFIVNYLFKASAKNSLHNKSLQLPCYNDFVTKVVEAFPGHKFSQINDHLTAQILFIEEYAIFWDKLLKRGKPKVVYTVCHYLLQNFAVTLAANRLGISVVEIQHGNVNNYPPYTLIQKKRIHYKLLPNYFWCWDKVSFKALSRTYFNSKNCKTYILGNPWTIIVSDEAWKKNNLKSTLATFKKNKKVLLYTLVYGQEVFPKIIKDIYSATKDEVIWWIRLHPRQLDDYNRILAELSMNGISENIIKVPTVEPLPVVLANTDVHITSVSSVVLEAKQYGIPNFVITKEGWDRYHEILDLVFIKEASEFSFAIQNIGDNKSVGEGINEKAKNHFYSFHSRLTTI